jgi:hypothetical protein
MSKKEESMTQKDEKIRRLDKFFEASGGKDNAAGLYG